MNFIKNFSIEKINDLKSKLFFNGKYTGTNICGIDLRYQIKILDKYYLIITDYDCPFEETTEIALINTNFKFLSRKSIGGPYYSWDIYNVEFIDSQNINLIFGDNIMRITLREFSIPYLFPKMKITRLKLNKNT